MSEAPPLADSRLAALIAADLDEPRVEADTHPCWDAVAAAGTEPWLDTGDVEAATRVWDGNFRALTTNNTLLNAEVQKGIYDEWVPQAAAAAKEDRPDLDEKGLLLEVAFALNARHGLRLVRRFGVKVSVELHTDLAHDVEASVAYGRRYAALCPDFVVKVPNTPAGLVAARRLHEEGIPVNFTLGFSARQNYLAACVARPGWVNVFLGRLNAWVADEGLGDGELVGEKATLASQLVVRALREERDYPTRQIAASMRAGHQVAALAGVDVHTVPVAAAEQFLLECDRLDVRDHVCDELAPTWADGVDPEREGLTALWEVPAEFAAVCDALGELPLRELTSDEIVARLDDAGFLGVFPPLDDAGLAALAADGKAPKRERWRDDVLAGRCAWDGLFTLAGLQAFAKDQAAFDARIHRRLFGA